MNGTESQTELAKARSHMANERTHLSIVRTSVALIGLGISMNRFSLFLLQNEVHQKSNAGSTLLKDTENFGIGMFVLGCLLLLWSTFRFIKIGKDIERMRFRVDRISIIFFSILILIGSAIGASIILH